MDSFILPEDIRDDLSVPKYHQVHAQLKKELHFGNYSPGDRFFSVRTLMDTYSLNMKTIRSAIQLLEDDGFVVNRPAAGLYVNSVDKRKPGVPMGNVWFCQPGREKDHPYYNAMLSALQRQADAEGMNVIVSRNCDATSFPQWFKPETGDGLVVTGELDQAFIELLKSLKNTRLVVVGNYALPEGVPNVWHNIEDVVRHALTMSATAGRRRLGVISGPKERLVTQDILKGIDAVVQSTPLEYVDGVFDEAEDGHAAMSKLWESNIDSVLVTEPAYFSLCRFIFENRIKCPEDLFVIRFGKNVEVNGYNDIASLTTFSNPNVITTEALKILFSSNHTLVEIKEEVVSSCAVKIP